MWYRGVNSAPGTEPVTLAQAKDQCAIDTSETAFDTYLTRLITVARAYAEAYCDVRFGSRTSVARCDSFADMARLPEAPVISVTSIVYTDTGGAPQTLSTSVYELRNENMDAAVVLKYGQNWPTIQPGSRIVLTAVVGYGTSPFGTVPADAVHAMLMHIADAFAQRENAKIHDFSYVDALLINHRRGA